MVKSKIFSSYQTRFTLSDIFDRSDCSQYISFMMTCRNAHNTFILHNKIPRRY